MIIIGIDPGNSGGIAWVSIETGIVSATKMPDTESDLAQLLRQFDPCDMVAYMEAVGPARGRNKDGSDRTQGVVSAFKFGVSVGLLRGMLIALGIPLHEVTPQRWQKEHGLIRQGAKLTQTERKNRNKSLAQKMWPNLRITHATADALLIMEFGIKERQRRSMVFPAPQMAGNEPF